jgi:L-rhamnose-H+ transport protein
MLWIAVAMFAGVWTGSFGLPMKFTTKWKWENTWSMWSVWTLLFVPWTIAFLTVPDLLEVYRQVSWSALGWVSLFGFIWGFSAIAFGMGIDYLGLALGYSLMMGLIISVGSLLPLFTRHPEKILEQSGLTIIAGVVVIIAGVIISAVSALIKQKDLARPADTSEADQGDSANNKPAATRLKGVMICIVAGVTGPMLNYAFIYGDQLRAKAEELGAGKTMAPNSIWAIALFSGFFVNIFYCLYLIKKNKAWNLFREKGTKPYYLYTLIMGILWAGSIAIFGMATANLGELGPSIGWAVFNAVGIAWANMLGIFTGEWKGVSRKGIRVMAAGLVVILLGVGIVGWANSLE